MKRLILLIGIIVPALAGARTFSEIATEIAANNPSLQAEKAAAAADEQARTAANRLEGTEAAFTHQWPVHRAAGTKLGFELSQEFEWPGAYGARRRAARSAASAAERKVQAAARTLDLEVRTALCDLVDANRRICLLREIVTNLDSLHSRMHTLLEGGRVTELDHRKVALEEISMKQQLADARTDRADALAALYSLNGGALPDGVEDLSDYPAAELLPLQAYIAMGSPAHEAALFEAETRALDARAERMGLLPGFSVGYALDREDGEIFQGFTVGLRLPRYAARPAAAAARLEAEALTLQAEAAEAARRAALTSTYRRAENTRKLLSDYEQALGTDYPALLMKSLTAGQITYIDYFAELNFYLTARLEFCARQLLYYRMLESLAHP